MRIVEVAGVQVPHPDEVFLGGAWVPGAGGTTEVVSPATEQVVATVALPSTAQAVEAVRRAHDEGMTGWAALSVAERVGLTRRFCALMESRFDDIGRLWAAEAGMPLRYSKNLHRFGAAGAWAAALDAAESVLADEWRTGAGGAEVLIRREPAGVVVGIMAYNGPIVTVGTKIVPALLAGCPVVVKAAPESHLVMRVVASCAEEAGLPAGTLSVLSGDVEIGQALTADSRVDLVSLTGGQRAAQDIIEATRARFARTHLELGGKSAALVLPDADLTRVVRNLVPGAASGAGQVCALLTRVLVPEERHDELVEALAATWSALRVGDPYDDATQVGPLANRAALDRTEGFVARALVEGCRIVAGGGRPAGLDRGYFHEPTIVTDVARDSYLANNEVFGPVTAVLTYTDVADGIALANSTGFGLAATVYTVNRDAAVEVAGRLRAGSVALNTFGPDVTAPWGGRASSGWGREGGPEGILEFTELKQILVGPGMG